MLQRIIDFSLKNKFIVLLATVGLVLGGVYAVKNIPLDAIPDLSDTQVIIYTGWEGQAPNIIEDQVTYPITAKMLSVPRQKAVRGYSFYGFSFVYVIFEDGTDPYWARSRVLEYLSSISGQCSGSWRYASGVCHDLLRRPQRARVCPGRRCRLEGSRRSLRPARSWVSALPTSPTKGPGTHVPGPLFLLLSLAAAQFDCTRKYCAGTPLVRGEGRTAELPL